MRIFKAKYRDRKGREQTAKRWYIEFVDDARVVHKLAAFTDRKATQELADNIRKLVEYKAVGRPLDAAMMKWLEGVPANLRRRLSGETRRRGRNQQRALNLLDPATTVGCKPLKDHLDDFHAALVAKGTSKRQADLVVGRARRVLSGCGFKLWSDVSASRVMKYLHDLRQDTEVRDDNGEVKDVKRGISNQTFNFYVQAARQFGRWMVRDRRTTESPLDYLTGINVRTDRRHDRRALTPDELRRLLAEAEIGPDRRGMTGHERVEGERTAVAYQGEPRLGRRSAHRHRFGGLLEAPPRRCAAHAAGRGRVDAEVPRRKAAGGTGVQDAGERAGCADVQGGPGSGGNPLSRRERTVRGLPCPATHVHQQPRERRRATEGRPDVGPAQHSHVDPGSV